LKYFLIRKALTFFLLKHFWHLDSVFAFRPNDQNCQAYLSYANFHILLKDAAFAYKLRLIFIAVLYVKK